MVNSGLNTVLKLSCLILFAFGVCPKTKGLTEEDEAALSQFKKFNKNVFTYVLKCPPSVAEGVNACYSDAVLTESFTNGTQVEICKATKTASGCVQNGFQACGVDQNLRAEVTKNIKKFLTINSCSLTEYPSGAHQTTSPLYFGVLAVVVNNVLKLVY